MYINSSLIEPFAYQPVIDHTQRSQIGQVSQQINEFW